jgi:hypothetical protein
LLLLLLLLLGVEGLEALEEEEEEFVGVALLDLVPLVVALVVAVVDFEVVALEAIVALLAGAGLTVVALVEEEIVDDFCVVAFVAFGEALGEAADFSTPDSYIVVLRAEVCFGDSESTFLTGRGVGLVGLGATALFEEELADDFKEELIIFVDVVLSFFDADDARRVCCVGVAERARGCSE